MEQRSPESCSSSSSTCTAGSQSLIMSILNPDPMTAIITVLVILLTPVILHFLVFRSRASTTLPMFVLLGPAGSGKTSLMTTFANATTPETRTSQAPLSLEADIPAKLSASSKYRSSSDPLLSRVERFMLQDTPGHGKLRPSALGFIAAPGVRGLVFVIDSSVVELSGAAEYLYSVLLAVQKLQESKNAGGKHTIFRVLIACNKSDLFTALPAGRVKKILEEEVAKVREAKSRGIVGVGEEDKEEEDWLGEGGSGNFTFEGLEEVGIEVDVRGGCVPDDGWREKLGEWIGKSL